jgi:putative intracellular protease/amidase
MKLLMILTSHDQLGNTGAKTGFWLDEFAAPYYVFKDAGIVPVLASPKGGQPPLDPKSDDPAFHTPATARFKTDEETAKRLANTVPLSSVKAADFDAVFFPGGHGPLWDLAEDRTSISLVESMIAANKPVAAVCHGPAALVKAKGPDGLPLFAGRKVTGFSNSEEAAVGLTAIVPLLIEDTVNKLGGTYVKGPDWGPFVSVDGLLITGQNPGSSEATAKALLDKVGAAKR